MGKLGATAGRLRRLGWKRLVAYAAAAAIAVVAIMQAVPYGRSHTNPPVAAEPAWDSPTTRALAVRACFDCHSNETGWPWYSNIAPVSWLIQSDVNSGRETLNFSEWDRPQESALEAAAAAQSGEMPPFQYRLIHPKARLSAAEKAALVRGLVATLGGTTGQAGR